MSDLQCPATFLVVGLAPPAPPAPPVPPGRLAVELRDRRIALVASGPEAPVLAAAEGVAEQLGVPHRTVDELESLVGPAGAGADAAGADHRAVLDALADQYRGETVLVLADAGVLTALWPGAPGRDEDAPPSPYRLVQVEVDGDGWRRIAPAVGG